MSIKTYNTVVMERIWIGKLCFSFHPDTGAHDEHVIAVREELSLHFFFTADVTDGMRVTLETSLVTAFLDFSYHVS